MARLMPRDKEQAREYSRLWTNNRRVAWIESKGSKCNLCGITNVPFDIDHVDPKTKTYRVANIWGRNEQIRTTELAKCQVLCKPCHKAKTRVEQYIANPEHATRIMYMSRGCRCRPCVRWNTNRKKIKQWQNGIALKNGVTLEQKPSNTSSLSA
jgi:hypothetical protein